MRIDTFLLVFLLLGVCCKKERIGAGVKPSEVLAPGQWKLEKLTIETPPGSAAADITAATFDPCELDDLMEFKTGNMFSCIENTNVCAANSGIFFNLSGGNWFLSGDTSLTIAAGFNVQNFRFGKVTTSAIELQQTFTNYFGETSRHTFLLNKQ
jgi:hypothetical protein